MQKIGVYLAIDSEKNVVKCSKCGHEFCEGTENYKKYSLIKERSFKEFGSIYSKTDRFIMREFYCPQCATLLTVEMTRKNSPIIWDVQLKAQG